MSSVSELKKEYRTEAAARLEGASEEYILSASAAIAVNILSLPEIRKARTVLAYYSVGKEPATLAIISKLIESGKKVCLPRCTDFDQDGSRISDEPSMEARRIRSLDMLIPGAYGIAEPPADDSLCPVIKPHKIDAIILPCVAAATDLSRLGHGAGYYDRYLNEVGRNCHKAVLCYDKLIFDKLPTDVHDVYMDSVVSESNVIRKV